MNYDDNLLLIEAMSEGIIDLPTVRAQLMEKEKTRYLNMHSYSIWQGKNGMWYTKIPLENGDKKLIKKKAKEAVEDAIVEYYKGAPLTSKAPTFKYFFMEWVKEKIRYREICQGTYDRYTGEFERFFKGTWIYSAPMDSINEMMLDEFVRNRIVDLNLTAKAYGNMRTLILGTFKYAKRKGATDISITHFFADMGLSRRVFKKTAKRNDDEQVFSDEETKLITDWLMKHPTIENYGILLVFYSGIREGELSAVRFSDLKGNKLHIHSQEVKYKDIENKGKLVHEIVDYTKSEAGDRFIVIPQIALDIIAELRKMNPTNDIMMQKGNRKFWTNTFNDRLYKACDEVGIPRRSMHKIRKTYGTRLLDGGVEESFAMSQMGHSDINTTRKHYYFGTKNDSYKTEVIERVMQF